MSDAIAWGGAVYVVAAVMLLAAIYCVQREAVSPAPALPRFSG